MREQGGTEPLPISSVLFVHEKAEQGRAGCWPVAGTQTLPGPWQHPARLSLRAGPVTLLWSPLCSIGITVSSFMGPAALARAFPSSRSWTPRPQKSTGNQAQARLRLLWEPGGRGMGTFHPHRGQVPRSWLKLCGQTVCTCRTKWCMSLAGACCWGQVEWDLFQNSAWGLEHQGTRKGAWGWGRRSVWLWGGRVA